MKHRPLLRILSLILMLALLTTLIPAQAFAASGSYNFYVASGGTQYIVTKDSAPLRAKSNDDGKILCRLSKNQVITVVDTFWTWRGTKWHEVKCTKDGKSVTGYIYSGNISKLHYEKYRGSSSSIIDILKALKVDSSFSHRQKIARANGFSGDSYVGEASQNSELARRAKAGLLVRSGFNPIYDSAPSTPSSSSSSSSSGKSSSPSSSSNTGFSPSTSASTSNDQAFFPPCDPAELSIIDGLKSVGAYDESTFSGRAKLAVLNGIVSSTDEFKGDSQQNLALLALLRAGRLRRLSSSSTNSTASNDDSNSSSSTENSSPVSTPSTSTAPFSTIEIYGFAGKTYITTKDSASLKSSPSNSGMTLAFLPKTFPVESEGLYRTKDSSLWIKVKTADYSEAWVHLEDVQLHNCSFIELTEYGFEFCNKCGHLRAINPDAYKLDMDVLHIILAAASLIPVVGNGFDLLDGMVSLLEGDRASAFLSFASAVPAFGSIGNTLRVTGNTIEIFDTSSDIITATRVSSTSVEVGAKSSSRILRKNLNIRYLETLDDRFYDYADYWLPPRSIAAHHIVAGGASDIYALSSRRLLNYLDIGINSAENGVYLCMRSDNCLEGVIHATKHSPEYYKAVNKRLLDAFNGVRGSLYMSADAMKTAQREAVVDALDSIARDLMYGNTNIPW